MRRYLTKRQANLVALADGGATTPPLTPDELKWLYIDAVLICEGDNVTRTARRLGMHRRTLQRIIAAHKGDGE
jgi:two-component system response regulator RegA